MSVTTATDLGHRPYQEDRYFAVTTDLGLLLGVLDGHGGDDCSDWLVDNLPGLLTTEIQMAHDNGQSIVSAINAAFGKAASATEHRANGSTAAVVFIPRGEDKAYISILGDSQVIARNPSGIHVSPEHNVRTNKDEKEAAIERGGVYIKGYIYRRLSGDGLQMARAFGDSDLGEVVSKVPETYEIQLGDWLLLVTDGAIEPGHKYVDVQIEEIVKVVDAGKDAQAIVKRALDIPTGDNVTAVLWRR